jgi:hypothetical protein
LNANANDKHNREVKTSSFDNTILDRNPERVRVTTVAATTVLQNHQNHNCEGEGEEDHD